MANKSGVLRKPNGEWGSKMQKEDDHLRGLNQRGRRETIQEQVNEMLDDEEV